jgi:hypothetical protein
MTLQIFCIEKQEPQKQAYFSHLIPVKILNKKYEEQRMNSRRWQGQNKSRCEKEWRAKIETEALLRSRDVYPGSRIPDPGSRIQDPKN